MPETSLIPTERIEPRILLLRGQKVMLDFHLAELYEVETRSLNQAVKRNIERFPEDFMFQLTEEEAGQILRSQIVTLNADMRSQTVIASKRNVRFLPFAFTEQGVAMLSGILRSPRAVAVNIAVIRTFVKLRQMLSENTELARRLDALERKFDTQFKVVFDTIRELMKPITPAEARREIGFHTLMPKRAAKSRARGVTKVST